MTEAETTPWVAEQRAAAARADRVFVPVPVPELPGVIALPSRAAYRLDAVGTRRRLVPKIRSTKERRRIREGLRRAQEAIRQQADSATERGGDSSCSPA